ncbi:hypothetical protein QBC33DRAFT_451610 [Phialemonium atrogriseum]|uniref:Erythromycin biosynthesis protein CIII-like C-terminal domain-containing protein n=1 Tax=Phialemonium atrogriseum TaxID=1093897 RepID=A0AAJ0BZQ5_9PEZI|nr:uncharacterized protein QBC33DRAFT_451610 [Phialemonium atrogriseum]KAK1767495.1 hypothetical protein QBC33DRAFT_451610 [Phialemonium atrogriseum]
MSEPSQRPILLFLCHPLTGHFIPVIKIASALRGRGWDVCFLGASFFRSRIEASGAEFFQLQGKADLDDAKLFDRDTSVPRGAADDKTYRARSIIDTRHQTLHAIPAAWESVRAALLELHQRNAGRQVIVICEAFFYGFMPLRYGAPLPTGVKVPRSICISILSPAIRSIDLPPFSYPAPFEPTYAGRVRNKEMWASWEKLARPVTQLIDNKLAEAGATRGVGEVFMGGANYTCHDAILQIGLSAFEYPRSDFPPNFKIIGIIPPGPLDWWQDVVSNSDLDHNDERKKKVIVVAQGTVETDPNELIIPTLQWLADHKDIMTVAILGHRGASLPPDFDVPGNARIADYLQYDAILPHANLWIHNGGYGATMHGLAHGVPMVIAGEGQDKAESAKRVAWSGVGVDLECARPGIERIGRAIEKVLGEGTYKETAAAMKLLAEGLDCFGDVEREVLSMIDT